MSFNPFIGSSSGGNADTFTKEEIIELLKLELDVADYQRDKLVVDQKIQDVEQIAEKVQEENNNTATDDDINDLF